MRKTQFCLLGALVSALVSTVAQAEVLIGWDGGTTTNTAMQASGISGTLFANKLYSIDATAGSTDGSFGEIFTGANTSATAYNARTASLGENNTVSFQIQNNTGAPLQLNTISFDYLAWFANSPKTIALTYAYGDLAVPDNTILQSISGLGDGGGKLSDYPDYDWTLENLSDYILADGERATFQLIATDALDGTTGGGFDNIAILGVGGSPVSVTVSTGAAEHAVTKMAMGSGLVYSWEPDALYADGEVAHIIKDIGVGTLRWPGGAVVTYFHWDALNGNGWTESWNPAYDPVDDKPQEDFMDVDEYLALIDRTGAEIMLGVNMSSGKEWDREAEGIGDAVALVQYVKDQGYDVEYIYFDNENFQPGNNYNNDANGDGGSWNPTNYAESFNLYAAAVKTVFPDAKLIANYLNNVTGSAFEAAMQTMLGIAGDNIDYVDIHWYWKWNTASWDLWKTQLPMLHGSVAYKDSVIYANNLFTTLGYPHVKMAVMEWNIGPGPWMTDPEHNGFKTALMQMEMQIQFLRAGLDIGLLYALQSPMVAANEDKHVLHSGNPNATALWMWLFSKLIDKTIVESSASVTGIYTVTAKGSHGELVTYLLNKTDSDQTVELNIPGYTVNEVNEAWRFTDDGAGNGALQKIALWEINGRKRTTLKADSLNMIGFNYPMEDTDGDGMVDAWEISAFGFITIADETSDTDGDGFSDYKEFIAGTDPNDPQTALSMQHTLFTPEEPFAETLLIGWDTSSKTADMAMPGVSGSLATGNLSAVDGTAGSTDGSFGTSTGAATALTAYAVRTADTGENDTLGFQIINNTGLDLHLSTIHFDYSRWYAASPQNVTLTYAWGDLDMANATVIASATEVPTTGKVNDYSDFNWSLTSLPDQILASGEKANFNLVASNASNESTNGAFDNVAISGSGVSTGAGTSMQIVWRGQTGRNYQLMQTTNLAAGTWQPATAPLQGVPGDNSASADFETPPIFYKLEVSP